ncbi:MAG: hypothetical protein PHP46_04760 [Candidatus Omnitrophica bacterium]|nr:hypothetical protein [Candidatus Omnitrophota bacterium]
MAKIMNILMLLLLVVSFSSCSNVDFSMPGSSIRIEDAKIASDIDKNFMPVKVMDMFTYGTSKVSCWFSWKDSPKDVVIVAKWRYVTDDIPIREYSFKIPRKDGTGGVSLAMPEGKALPPGLYRVELEINKKLVKSLGFRVLDNK